MSNAYEIALRLVKGETLDRKDVVPDIKGVLMYLEEFRHNAVRVINQLKKEGS